MNWIKINYDDESTLPTPGEHVLLAVNPQSGVRFVSEGWLCSAQEGSWQLEATDGYGDYIDLYGLEVEHWQPLPALPSEDSDA